MNGEAERLRERAVEAARLGRVEDAGALHDRAVALAPGDASILNSAAYFCSKQGNEERAIGLWRSAIAADRSAVEPLFNLALALTGTRQAEEARSLLVTREPELRSVARYWSIRAGAERALGRKRDAFSSYETAARLDPGNARAVHGRARMALETGRPAAALYQSFVAGQPADRDAWLGYAQALDAEHRDSEAGGLLETLIAKDPMWVEALELLAQLRWARGERDDFADHYAKAVNTGGGVPVFLSWCKTLAGVDRYAEAAEIAAGARIALGDSAGLALIEARHRGEAGDDAAAEAIFAALDLATPERFIHEARHRFRLGDCAAAEALCARVIDTRPDHVSAWALRGIAWRLMGDARSEWLHGQNGLIAPIPLDLDAAELQQAIDYLDRLHDDSAIPVGQSVRGGTQTRGGLFDRDDGEARRIEEAFRRAVDAYRDELPPRDDTHPLLRHRDDPWRIAGSWSIRLIDSGHHVQHIHPLGLISSAAYFAVPPSAADPAEKAGWLELGRPPADLRLDLPPIATIEPKVGQCVLFPSTLFHGTRAFPAGKRMSVAIDINLEGDR